MTKLTFTKDWTKRNPDDFPTIQTDEAQVRYDIQLLHNETKTALNNLIDDLAETEDGTSGASQIGATPFAGSAATNVQSLLSDLNTRTSVVERFNTLFANINSVQQTLASSTGAIPSSKAVADAISEAGGGNMMRESYDTTNTGTKVDTAINAEKLGNQLPSYYQQALTFDNTPTTDSNNPVKSGGIKSYIEARLKWLGKCTEFRGSTISHSSSVHIHSWSSPFRDDFGVSKPDTVGGTDYTKLYVPAGATKVIIRAMGNALIVSGLNVESGYSNLRLNGSTVESDWLRSSSYPFGGFTIKSYSSSIHGDTCSVVETLTGGEYLHTFSSPSDGTDYFDIYTSCGDYGSIAVGFITLEVLE